MLLPLTQVQSLAPNGVYGRRPGDNAAVDSLPDLLLIERSRGGEQRAIEALVRRYSRRLFRVARSVLVEEDAAESAGKYLAEHGPDVIRDRIVPKFIEAFNEAK